MDKDKLHVCKKCLVAIESHEGKQRTLEVDVELNLEDSTNIVCDWCGDYATILYEIG